MSNPYNKRNYAQEHQAATDRMLRENSVNRGYGGGGGIQNPIIGILAFLAVMGFIALMIYLFAYRH